MHPFEVILAILVLAGAISLIHNRTARERWAFAAIALLVVLGIVAGWAEARR